MSPTIDEVDGEVILYSDASQPRNGVGEVAVVGWLKPRYRSKRRKDPLVFEVIATRTFDTTHLEALGILRAISAQPDMKKITVFSDSKDGARLARAEIERVSCGHHIRDEFLSELVDEEKLKTCLNSTLVEVKWVRSHSDEPWNTAIDFLVKYARYTTNDLLPDGEELRQKVDMRMSQWLNTNNL